MFAAVENVGTRPTDLYFPIKLQSFERRCFPEYDSVKLLQRFKVAFMANLLHGLICFLKKNYDTDENNSNT